MTLKPYTPVHAQVDILRSRGMVLNVDTATLWLRSVGYYRLSGYWYPWRRADPRRPERRQDEFVPGTRFDDVIALYEADRQLRVLLHEGVERVEIGLRAHLAQLLGAHGALVYRDESVFRTTFDHARWLATADSRVSRAMRHHAAIRHHMSVYAGEVPVWVLVDVLDFRDISLLFSGLRADDQWTVADRMGVAIDLSALGRNQREKARRSHPLARVFEQITVVRNSVAHHARVWNRSFVPVGTTALRTLPQLEGLPEGQSEQVYGTVLLIGALVEALVPGTGWSERLGRLVRSEFEPIAGRSLTEMGWPSSAS